MKISQVLAYTVKRLKRKNIATAHLDAFLILQSLLGMNEVHLLQNMNEEFPEEKFGRLGALIEARETYYPIAYITHRKEFYGFDFYVDERVLIPRPETEMLVDEVISAARGMSDIRIVDVGTGSGCIAVVLSRLLGTRVIASDISLDALSVAEKNAEKHAACIDFVCADALSFLCSKVDIVVSNPPYIPYDMFERLPPDVKHEPKTALVCADDGFEVIKKLHSQAKWLSNYLIVEISEIVLPMIEKLDSLAYVKRDLSGQARVAVFRF